MNMHSMKIFFKERDREKISLSPSPNFPDIKQLIVTASVCFPHSFKIKFILLNRNYIICQLKKKSVHIHYCKILIFFPIFLNLKKYYSNSGKKIIPILDFDI